MAEAHDAWFAGGNCSAVELEQYPFAAKWPVDAAVAAAFPPARKFAADTVVGSEIDLVQEASLMPFRPTFSKMSFGCVVPLLRSIA
jgi:hypothetical protein